MSLFVGYLPIVASCRVVERSKHPEGILQEMLLKSHLGGSNWEQTLRRADFSRNTKVDFFSKTGFRQATNYAEEHNIPLVVSDFQTMLHCKLALQSSTGKWSEFALNSYVEEAFKNIPRVVDAKTGMTLTATLRRVFIHIAIAELRARKIKGRIVDRSRGTFDNDRCPVQQRPSQSALNESIFIRQALAKSFAERVRHEIEAILDTKFGGTRPSYASIARELNNRKVFTRRGRSWSAKQVSRVFKSMEEQGAA